MRRWGTALYDVNVKTYAELDDGLSVSASACRKSVISWLRDWGSQGWPGGQYQSYGGRARYADMPG